MKNQHSKFLVFLLAFGLIASQTLFAQSNKPVQQNEIRYSTSSSTNDLQSLSKVKPQEVQYSAEKTELLKQLEEARSTNNMTKKAEIESKLNDLNGSQPVTMQQSNNIHFQTIMTDGRPPMQGEHDYMTTQIGSGGFWATATQTTPSTFPVANVMWVIATQYNASGTDTCKFYFSTNSGVSWTYAYLFYFGSNMDFRAGELDLELAYDGSVVWLMGTAGISDMVANRTETMFFRINTTANTYSGYFLQWPGFATTSNLYYCPHITSDNTNYTTASYIYLSASFDSTGASTHINRMKYAHITNPFAASPTIDYTMGSGNGGFWWNSTVPAGTYLWTDIAYLRPTGSTNRILSVYNVPGSSNYNLYLAYTDDYGATVGGSSSISETSVDFGARIAFNGAALTTGMIAYVRQFSGTDWDPYTRATTDAGTTWTAGYIDGSSNRCRSVDLIAVRGVSNIFKVGYIQDSTAGDYAFYTGGNLSAGFNQPSRLAISPVGADSTFSKCTAGYKNGGGDDCFAVYSLGSGTNVYGSRLCQTTVGVENNNNQIPQTYSLLQNYPNPFNPSTSIKFDLPKQGIVKLTVYDVLGNVVAVLANGNFEAGQHSITFDASNYASGIYLYKLEANGFSDVKKMMLIK